MNAEKSASWANRLCALRGLKPSARRDVDLADLFDEPFDGDNEACIDQLFLSFTSQIDSSVLQESENAFGRVGYREYYSGLGRCFEAMAEINPRIAVERINYASRKLLGEEVEEGFRLFISGLRSLELLELMRRTIIEWRLMNSEPYCSFLSLAGGGEARHG